MYQLRVEFTLRLVKARARRQLTTTPSIHALRGAMLAQLSDEVSESDVSITHRIDDVYDVGIVVELAPAATSLIASLLQPSFASGVGAAIGADIEMPALPTQMLRLVQHAAFPQPLPPRPAPSPVYVTPTPPPPRSEDAQYLVLPPASPPRDGTDDGPGLDINSTAEQRVHESTGTDKATTAWVACYVLGALVFILTCFITICCRIMRKQHVDTAGPHLPGASAGAGKERNSAGQKSHAGRIDSDYTPRTIGATSSITSSPSFLPSMQSVFGGLLSFRTASGTATTGARAHCCAASPSDSKRGMTQPQGASMLEEQRRSSRRASHSSRRSSGSRRDSDDLADEVWGEIRKTLSLMHEHREQRSSQGSSPRSPTVLGTLPTSPSSSVSPTRLRRNTPPRMRLERLSKALDDPAIQRTLSQSRRSEGAPLPTSSPPASPLSHQTANNTPTPSPRLSIRAEHRTGSMRQAVADIFKRACARH